MNSPGALAHHLDGIRILDLFAGPGGLDVAAHFLGFKSLGIEWDRNACETRYAAGLPTIHADVSVMRQTRFHEIPESVDVLAGGPPCQSFSVAGTGAGRVALDTVKEFIHRLVSGEDEERSTRSCMLWAIPAPPWSWNRSAGSSRPSIQKGATPTTSLFWSKYPRYCRSGRCTRRY